MPDKIQSVLRAVLIESVYTKQVSNNTKTLWTIVADGREFTTLQPPLGNKAKSLEQKICDLQISVVQKDQYTNFYLDGIQLNTEVQQPSGVVQAAQQAQSAAQGGPGVTSYVSYDEYKDLTEGKEQRKQESIHRQTAAKVAAALLPQNPQEFWSNVNEIVTFFNTGSNPYFSTQVPESSVTSHTADPGPDNGFPHTDDDIPF